MIELTILCDCSELLRTLFCDIAAEAINGCRPPEGLCVLHAGGVGGVGGDEIAPVMCAVICAVICADIGKDDTWLNAKSNVPFGAKVLFETKVPLSGNVFDGNDGTDGPVLGTLLVVK